MTTQLLLVSLFRTDGAVIPRLLYAFKAREGKTLSLSFRVEVIEQYGANYMVLVVVAAVAALVCASTIFNQIKYVQESCWENSDIMG